MSSFSPSLTFIPLKSLVISFKKKKKRRRYGCTVFFTSTCFYCLHLTPPHLYLRATSFTQSEYGAVIPPSKLESSYRYTQTHFWSHYILSLANVFSPSPLPASFFFFHKFFSWCFCILVLSILHGTSVSLFSSFARPASLCSIIFSHSAFSRQKVGRCQYPEPSQPTFPLAVQTQNVLHIIYTYCNKCHFTVTKQLAITIYSYCNNYTVAIVKGINICIILFGGR